MKKRHVIALLLCTLMLTACGGGKPKEMDAQTYELGVKAVELAQDFLDKKLPADEASDKIHDVYDDIKALNFDPKEEQKKDYYNSMVKTKVLSFTIDLFSGNTEYEMNKQVEEDLKELKDYLGIK